MIIGTILSTLFGGGGAILSNIIKVITEGSQDKRDKSHELSMYQLQLEAAKTQAATTADAAWSQAVAGTIDTSIKSDNWFVAFLNGIIRPVTTICFTAAFCFFLYAVYTYSINKELPPLLILELPIFQRFMEFESFILGFWFLNRQLSK